MELKSIAYMQKSNKTSDKLFPRILLSIAFILFVAYYVYSFSTGTTNNILLVISAIFGAYMAMNIGANDVANNVGPAVGSNALSIFWAIILAAVFESAGALIAGGDVVGTIKKGIINPALIQNADIFIWIMMAALLAGALWLNLATAFGAPVSTTHSIVGGVTGAGIAAAGWSIVSWSKMGAIVASWVISPLLGGLIAAGFLIFIKKTIIFKDDQRLAAKTIVPILIAIMTWAFSTYILLKGFKHIIKLNFITASAAGLAIALLLYFLTKPSILRAADKLPNTRVSINKLFNIPLIFSAALLSFAHGANDVANAVGPLAAINDTIMNSSFSAKAHIPLWVMVVGALGISLGLALYGPKLIKKVGSEITELDQIRAFCVAMAAAITVIIASQLGLPVSSTHIALGGIFGVGFLREYLTRNEVQEIKEEIKKTHLQEQMEKLEEYKNELESLGKLKKVDPYLIKNLMSKINEEKKVINKIDAGKVHMSKIEKKAVKVVKKHELVKRSAIKMIVAAWLITVPAAGVLAAMLYYMLRGILLP